jgi:hypothetical protein
MRHSFICIYIYQYAQSNFKLSLCNKPLLKTCLMELFSFGWGTNRKRTVTSGGIITNTKQSTTSRKPCYKMRYEGLNRVNSVCNTDRCWNKTVPSTKLFWSIFCCQLHSLFWLLNNSIPLINNTFVLQTIFCLQIHQFTLSVLFKMSEGPFLPYVHTHEQHILVQMHVYCHMHSITKFC